MGEGTGPDSSFACWASRGIRAVFFKLILAANSNRWQQLQLWLCDCGAGSNVKFEFVGTSPLCAWLKLAPWNKQYWISFWFAAWLSIFPTYYKPKSNKRRAHREGKFFGYFLSLCIILAIMCLIASAFYSYVLAEIYRHGIFWKIIPCRFPLSVFLIDFCVYVWFWYEMRIISCNCALRYGPPLVNIKYYSTKGIFQANGVSYLDSQQLNFPWESA